MGDAKRPPDQARRCSVLSHVRSQDGPRCAVCNRWIRRAGDCDIFLARPAHALSPSSCRPTRFFYWDDIAGRRLSPDTVDSQEALERFAEPSGTDDRQARR